MAEQQTSPTPHNSSSSPDKIIISPPTTSADDIRQFQDLFKGEAHDLKHHKLLKILHTTAPSKIALLVDEALMEPADNMWENCRHHRIHVQKS